MGDRRSCETKAVTITRAVVGLRGSASVAAAPPDEPQKIEAPKEYGVCGANQVMHNSDVGRRHHHHDPTDNKPNKKNKDTLMVVVVRT